MHFDIVTLFPEMFAALNFGITGRAQDKNLINLEFWNPRDYTTDKYHKVDDSPYGGGPGMVMMFEPIKLALEAARQAIGTKPSLTIYLTPQGQALDQNVISKLSAETNIILLAGRYEGIDQRIVDHEVDLEISVGDYVLSGGELAAMIVIDAITRQIPGSLGDKDSCKQDSFATGILDHPSYTRPECIDGHVVPKVLLSGDHEAIARWRRQQALGRTWLRRRDLLEKTLLTQRDSVLLNEFIKNGDSYA